MAQATLTARDTVEMMHPSRMAHHVLSCYGRRTTADITDGRDWYLRARREARRMARATGTPWRRCAAIIAVLSPRTDWARVNVPAAWAVVEGADPSTIQRMGIYGTNVVKAYRLLSGEPIAHCVRGPKVSAFYAAIVGTGTVATVDTHAVKVATARQFGAIAPNAYAIVAEVYASCAEAVGVPVHELQAVTWCTMKRELTS